VRVAAVTGRAAIQSVQQRKDAAGSWARAYLHRKDLLQCGYFATPSISISEESSPLSSSMLYWQRRTVSQSCLSAWARGSAMICIGVMSIRNCHSRRMGGSYNTKSPASLGRFSPMSNTFLWRKHADVGNYILNFVVRESRTKSRHIGLTLGDGLGKGGIAFFLNECRAQIRDFQTFAHRAAGSIGGMAHHALDGEGILAGGLSLAKRGGHSENRK
jgi:hypothetical protein